MQRWGPALEARPQPWRQLGSAGYKELSRAGIEDGQAAIKLFVCGFARKQKPNYTYTCTYTHTHTDARAHAHARKHTHEHIYKHTIAHAEAVAAAVSYVCTYTDTQPCQQTLRLCLG